MKDKKGMISWDEIIKWLIILASIFFILSGIYLFREQIAINFERLAEFLRFGR